MKLLEYVDGRREERAQWDLGALEQKVLEQDSAFLERVVPLLPDAAERFSGDLVALDRGPLFQKLTRLCQLYSGATAEQRTWLRSRVDARLSSQLESYGLRAAVAGARDRAADYVGLALAAFALADLSSDVREVLMSAALLLRCAGLCGDAADLFEKGALLCGPAMAAVLRDFAARPASLQTLGVMGWHEIQTPEGPGYRFGLRGNATGL